jgi:bifunctional non-homologous end joining protein LigD
MARPFIGWRASTVSRAIVSKRTNGRRRTWVKVKCFNREFVVVGWSAPEGSRHRMGSLLLGYYASDGKLNLRGRVGTGMTVAELERPMAAT